MALPSVHSAVMGQAWTSPSPARFRAPLASSGNDRTDSVPVNRTKLALSIWPARLPTGSVPVGTPVLAAGVPASRLAPARAVMVNGVSTVVAGVAVGGVVASSTPTPVVAISAAEPAVSGGGASPAG